MVETTAPQSVVPFEADPPRRSPIPGGVLAAIGGPLLLAVCNAIVNSSPAWRGVESTADLVLALRESPGLVDVSNVVMLAAAVLLVPGIWAVTIALRPRTPRLAAIGGWLMASGYVLSIVLATDTITALAVAQSGTDPTAFGDAIDNHAPPSAILLYAGFGLGALVGGLILGIAMLRQHGTVPAWAGWALVASEPVRVIGLLGGIAIGPPLASLLIMVGFAGVLLFRKAPARES